MPLAVGPAGIANWARHPMRLVLRGIHWRTHSMHRRVKLICNLTHPAVSVALAARRKADTALINGG